MKKKTKIEKEEPHQVIEEQQKTICIIPARGGSKGITDKNILNIGGRILIDWSIRQARAVGLDILVSTDSQRYKDIIDAMYPTEKYCPFIRPDVLSTSVAPTLGVILHALDYVKNKGYNTFILLEPTSPLRLSADITIPLSILREKKAECVVSVCASHRMHPTLSFRINHGKIQPNTDIPHIRRQALEEFYHLTGTIYAAKIDFYLKHQTFVTPETQGYIVNSWQDFELDEPSDVDIINALIKRVL